MATDMLAGLKAAEVEGLGLYPDQFRHPVGFRQATGIRPSLQGSADPGAHLQCVGCIDQGTRRRARPHQWQRLPAGDQRWDPDRGGRIPRSGARPARLIFYPGNLIFDPKVDTLFAGKQALGKLDSSQQQALRAAAQRTGAHVLENLPATEDTGPFCSGGGRWVATHSDVRALKAATQPVYRQLAQDPQTAAFISQIQDLKAGMPAPTQLTQCGDSRSTGSAAQEVPDGTYTAVGTKQDALRLGGDDPCALKADGARLRLELTNGVWAQWVGCKIYPDTIGSQGTYTSTEKDLVLHETCCGDTTLDWSFDGKALTLKIRESDTPNVEPGDRFIWNHKWVKVR